MNFHRRRDNKNRKNKARAMLLAGKFFLPNCITLLSVFAAMSGIRFGLDAMWQHAVIAILLSVVLDGMDGRVARFIGSASDFGAILDSLADFVAFGSSTALIIYVYSLSELKEFGWGIALFYTACLGMRLARFNSGVSKLGRFLVGVPAPFGAIMAISPVFIDFAFKIKLPAYCFCVSFILSSFLTISKIPTLSLSQCKISARFMPAILFAIVLLVTLFLYNHWLVIFCITVSYVMSIPFTRSSYIRSLRLENDDNNICLSD
jgi:CDP-diacylglycerol--serine O-phosphatidyltransferase